MQLPTRHRSELPGRAAETAAIDGLLARAGQRDGAALLLHGEPGLGKTTLLGYAADTAAGRGFTVLTTGGLADETRLRYAALHRLLQPLQDRLAALPVDHARVLAPLLSPTGGTGDGGTDTAARTGTAAGGGRPGDALLRRLAALLDLLSGGGSGRPVLCCVDDADRLDPPSRAAIGYVARRLGGRPVALLATAGGEQALAGIPAHRLAPLDGPASRAVLAGRLPGRVPDRLVAALVRVAGGNPQALADLAGALTPAQRTGAAPPPASLPAGSVLRRAYQEQLARLPGPARRLLLLAGTGAGMRTGCLVQAAQLAGLDIAALAPAERCGLVQVTGDRVRFPHPLVRTIVYEAAPLAQRRTAQLRIAEAAAATGDCRRAAAAMARAAELTGEPGEAARRLVTAARYAWRAGCPERARRILRRVPRSAAEPATATTPVDPEGEWRLLAGEIELRTGAAAGLDSLLAAAAALAGTRPGLAIRALLRATEAAWFAGDHRRCREIAARAAALRRPDEPADQRQIQEYLAGFTALFTGDHRRAVVPLRRAVALAESLDDVVALVIAGAASLLLAEDQHAGRLADRAVEAARGTGYASALPLALELRGAAEFGLGRYRAAEGSCQVGWQAARTSGQANYAADHLALLAVLAAIRGDHPTCAQRLGELVVPPGVGSRCRPMALADWARAVLDLAGGRPAAAATRLAGIGDPATGHGQVVIQVLAAPWLVEAAARSGQHRQVTLAVLDLLERWAYSTQARLPRALVARCHALLAPRETGAAMAHYREAVRLHRPGEADFERARTELLFGQELRRQRRPREARAHLHQALEAFQHLCLPSWADRAASELRAAGERVHPALAAGTPAPGPAARPTRPDRRSGPRLELTPQQRQIAQLVALGATNREVAAQLFISPRTVDHHLRNIFHRLRIRSRVELAHRWSATGS